jgi:hypothetical protein
MQSDIVDRPNTRGTFLARLAGVEVSIGVTIIVGTFVVVVLKRIGIGPELPGILGLTPMLFGFLGFTLFLAGHGIKRFPAYPYAMHIPLVLWLAVVALAIA